MQLLHGIESLKALPPGMILSIGNFDGLHRGHQHLLDHCMALRRSASSAVAIVTFEPHPLTVLRPEIAPPRLTTLQQKRHALQLAGADVLIELAPTADVLNLSAEQFWHVLQNHTRPSHLVEGPTFNFGKDRKGTIALLKQYCQASPITLHTLSAVQAVLLDKTIVDISSSIVRFLLTYGRARDAGICLGRPYALAGEVIHGHHRGRTIGFPTANLDCPHQLVPADGVYAARCQIDGQFFPAALSIGSMPTFGPNRPQIEAHLIGFSGDLYGKTIELELIDWLRDQQKFHSIPALQAQLNRDIQRAGK